MRLFSLVTLALSLALCACQRADDDTGPHTSSWRVMAARREGAVVIYANTERAALMVDGFRKRYPGIEVRYANVTSNEIQQRVVNETGADQPRADLIWSSAMDIQIKLINDGYAAAYRSPEAHALPSWANWRNQGYGVSAEPVIFAYNKRYLPPDRVPRGHGDLLRLLRTHPDDYRGRLTTFDAETSGIGLLYLSADAQIYPDAWALTTAIGRTQPGLYRTGGEMFESVSSGRRPLAYNITLSHAEVWSQRNSDIVRIMPDDYYLAISRVAFINKSAAHPQAARLFLDYMLSLDGQRLLALGHIMPVRTDITPDAFRNDPRIRPIQVGPALLANHDQQTRLHILNAWRKAMGRPVQRQGETRATPPQSP